MIAANLVFMCLVLFGLFGTPIVGLLMALHHLSKDRN